jgi:hypothetical protein
MDIPARFRKKPTVIEAMQWSGENLRELISFTNFPSDTRSMHAGQKWEEYEGLVKREGLKIRTLEGWLTASKGDWIIKGTRGEHWPVKPEIFADTYEPI